MTTINAQSGHTLHVQKIDANEMPDFEHKAAYATFYVVRNWDENGVVFFYLAKDHREDPRQIVVWYRDGKFWSGYGTSMKDAIDGAQKDGWLYA